MFLCGERVANKHSTFPLILLHEVFYKEPFKLVKVLFIQEKLQIEDHLEKVRMHTNKKKSKLRLARDIRAFGVISLPN